MKTILAIYKPVGMTSHDIVNKVRKITGIKRVGHGGTLDPLASGVLVIAIGRENTKQLDTFVKKEKEYTAAIHLGFESTTDDSEGNKTEINASLIPTHDDIVRSSQKFIGLLPQMPPLYSAKKVKGREAYKYARAGMKIELTPKIVEITDIKISQYTYPIVTIRVTCGPGVYIRSLARDIGADLGTGAYIKSLERTRVGEFKKEDCITLDQLTKTYT